MKTKLLKYFAVLLFVGVINPGCSDEKADLKVQNLFSIKLENDYDRTQADSIIAMLKNEIPDSLYLINDDDFYTVNIGYFSTSLTAGEKAFSFYSDSLIKNYNIYYGDTAKVYDEFRYVPFLGEYLNRPSLYKYDIIKKKKWLVWSKWGRKIVSLTYPKNFSPAFFLTALAYGRKAGFPYIIDARSYKYNTINNSVKLIEKLGTGLQVFSNYNSSSNYEVYFNILDSSNTENIIQIKNEYDLHGVKVYTEEKYFNILEDGYPIPKITLPRLVSPGKNFYLKAEGTEEGISYFLNNYKKDKRDFIFSSSDELAKVDWSRNEIYLILSFKNLTASPEYSKLIIINTEDASIINEFENGGAVSFIVHGDLVIFEHWNQNDPQIIIYNYKNRILYDTISVRGGCGLNYIKSEFIGN